MGKGGKGEFGYLKRQRGRTFLVMVFLYAMALMMFFGARAYFGTNRNLFTILAVLVVLPAARYTVNFMMLLQAGECPEKVYAGVERHVGALDNAYDLYFTSEKKNFNIRHLSIGGGCIAALTTDPKCDCRAGEQHLRRMLTGNGIHGYQLKIFRDLPAYLTRLDQMNDLEEDGRDHGKILELLYRISL